MVKSLSLSARKARKARLAPGSRVELSLGMLPCSLKVIASDRPFFNKKRGLRVMTFVILYFPLPSYQESPMWIFSALRFSDGATTSTSAEGASRLINCADVKYGKTRKNRHAYLGPCWFADPDNKFVSLVGKMRQNCKNYHYRRTYFSLMLLTEWCRLWKMFWQAFSPEVDIIWGGLPVRCSPAASWWPVRVDLTERIRNGSPVLFTTI